MTPISNLFTPVKLGDLELPNRVLMAPLTRNRSQSDGTPSSMAELYYNQRASAGLIFSEATQVSDLGKGYLDTPGIYTDDHVTGWSKITDAVHSGGGRIFCQLWHVGRISHVSLLPEGKSPVSASDLQADAQTFTENGFEQCSKPEALTSEGIAQIIKDYAHAAKCAKEAGFDGIELHAANGYLLDQFLQDGVNTRTDSYGGSIGNRMRLLEEILDAVEAVWPKGRIGVRLSPLGQAGDISDSNSEALFTEVYKMLDARALAYLHVVEAFPGSEGEDEGRELLARLKQHYTGFFIANGGYDASSASEAILEERAHAVTFGRPFIANPDLPDRMRTGADMNKQDQDTFYGGDEKGYTDYPFLNR
ncbi:alkene reductase [Sulfitobacter guttiformis]|uniref:N-ethylmaleimide reductase n=1 Tax=Sulfitobacter guttiformis TaxID=74349 RepID=A0A420DU06_9RHOB|nr:alkene reductase [Sulfitobacter guttiformis]KIN71324.1 GTN reductase [Sulfitobacter guttiformis KCTC 32187]RKE97776.1 N-ethylmaleimide reductase [Sulfitobacter guttiformis]